MIYNLQLIYDIRTITFKVEVDKEMSSSIFVRPYCMNLYDTGQRLNTRELVCILNAFFIEKEYEGE